MTFRSTSFLLIPCLALLAPAAPAQCQVARLAADAPQAYAHFGASVAISGDRIVVGETFYAAGGITPGAAYVYQRGAAGWQQQALLLASDGADFDDFGISVAIDGDTILVGADTTDGPLSGAVGAVYVFQWDGAQWRETQKLQARDGASGGFFGMAVALQGDRAVIGRFWDDAAAPHAGSAYVFRRVGGAWRQQQKLLPSNPAAEDNFGWSVAVSGARVVVGAPERFSAAAHDPQLGRVFVYDDTGTSWAETAVLTPSQPAPFDQFGISVAVDGDRIAAGAWQDSFYPPTSDIGAAYVFDWDGAAWNETQALVPADGTLQGEFGAAVALQGPWLLVGSPSLDNYPLWGGVYAYHRDEASGGWKRAALFLPQPNASLSWHGNAVALDGNYAVAGAFIESLSVTDYQCGTAYVYGGFAPWTDLGGGLAGSNGIPRLQGGGSLCAGTRAVLRLSGALPGSPAALFVGARIANQPFHGGTLVPAPDFVRTGLVTDAAGALALGARVPGNLPAGSAYYLQVWVEDPAGVQGASASNALSAATP